MRGVRGPRPGNHRIGGAIGRVFTRIARRAHARLALQLPGAQERKQRTVAHSVETRVTRNCWGRSRARIVPAQIALSQIRAFG